MIKAKKENGEIFKCRRFENEVVKDAVYKAAFGVCEIRIDDICTHSKLDSYGNRCVTVPKCSIVLEGDSEIDIQGFCGVIHHNMATNMQDKVESGKFSMDFFLDVWKKGRISEKEFYNGCILWCNNTNEYQAVNDAPRPEAANDNKRKRVDQSDEDQSNEDQPDEDQPDEGQPDEDQFDEESEEDQHEGMPSLRIRGMLTQRVISSKNAKIIGEYLENHKDMAYAERLNLVDLFVRANLNMTGNMHVWALLTRHLKKSPSRDLKDIIARSNLAPDIADNMLLEYV